VKPILHVRKNAALLRKLHVMFNSFFDTWYNKYALIVLAGAVGFLGYSWIDWRLLDATVWGTWTGALGTIAAVLGTFWIANRQAREQAQVRRRDELVRMSIAAPKIAVELTHITTILEGASKGFATLIEADILAPQVKILLGQIIEIKPNILDQTILDIAPMGNNAALHLAAGMAHFRSTQALINLSMQMLSTPDVVRGGTRIEQLKIIRKNLTLALTPLQKVTVECRKISDPYLSQLT
jgi:hypothetical protein